MEHPRPEQQPELAGTRISYETVILNAINRAIAARGNDLDGFPEFVEAFYLSLPPQLTPEVKRWRESEWEEIKQNAKGKFTVEGKAKTWVYEQLVEKMKEELGKAGYLFRVLDRRPHGHG